MIEYQVLALLVKFTVFLICIWGWTKYDNSLFAWGALISFLVLLNI